MNLPPEAPTVAASGALLRDIGEDELLALIFPRLAGAPSPYVVIGPGDDTAVVAAPDRRFVATTDAMVRNHDWRDEWSGGADVGAKAAAQNLADVAAMGAVPSGLLVTLAADPATPVAWVLKLTTGLARAAADAATTVVGGDLSAAAAGTVLVSVTAFGDLQGREPVLRSGAREGDVVAVVGTLGRAAAGLELLRDAREQDGPELVAVQRTPRPPYQQGPIAATAGAHAMLDLSDGLVRDTGRVARASGVHIDLSVRALAPDVAALQPVLGEAAAWDCVLGGGEDHSLLACFAAAHVPPGWRVVGSVTSSCASDDTPRVTVDGDAAPTRGWDHFGG